MIRRVICRLMTALLALIMLPTISFPAIAEMDFMSFMPMRRFEGKTYEARSASSLNTVLLIGYDHNDEGILDDAQEGYIYGGQSDFLMVLAIDHDAKQIRRMQINRDTMAEVQVYSRAGLSLGRRRMQICLSHAYGETQEINNRNTIWAVENYLGIADEDDGAQIDWYMSMDISGIARLNDLLGGVTVPIEDDFSRVDPTMVQGTTMTLTGEQAEYYCRGRGRVADQTNANRMKRQRIYMNAASRLLVEKLRADSGYAMELLSGMGMIFDTSSQLDASFGFSTSDYEGTPVTDTPTHFLMTNKSMEGIAKLMLQVMDYEICDMEYIEGEHQIGTSGYVEYITKKDAGLKWALDALYRPVK